jgi:hypothetical protein
MSAASPWTFFDGPQRRLAQYCTLNFVLRIELRHPRVQIPTQIIKARLRDIARTSATVFLHAETQSRHPPLARQYCRCSSAPAPARPRRAKSGQSYPQHRIPHVPNVRRFIRINTGVLDDDFLVGRKFSAYLCLGVFLRVSPKHAAIEKYVQISRAGNLYTQNTRHLWQACRNLLRNSAAHASAVLPTQNKPASRFAHLQFRRPPAQPQSPRHTALGYVRPALVSASAEELNTRGLGFLGIDNHTV